MGKQSEMEELELIKSLPNYFKGKKVFLTGHTGFKGSWLLKILHEFGADITGYALAPETEKALYCSIQGDKLCHSIIADIRDKEKFQKAIRDAKPDFLFHLAAQPLVLESYKDPITTYETNVMGTAYMLDALRDFGKTCYVVNITTDKVYENIETLKPYTEDMRLGGFDPYSNSKACAELVSSSFRNSFFSPENFAEHGIALATARSGNVIGGGDWSENRIIPDLARSLLKNEVLILRNPNAVRPWQHVLDPLYGYLLLAARLSENPKKLASGFNFGPYENDQLTVEQLVAKAIETWGSGSYKIAENAIKPHEANLLKLDIKKAEKEIAWKPRLNSSEAIELTIEWYKNSDERALELTEKQLKAYFHL